MRPKERRDSGQKDLFRARLDQIVDMGHPLVKLAQAIDCNGTIRNSVYGLSG